MTGSVAVTGGAYGIEANADELDSLSVRLGRIGDDGGLAAAGVRALADDPRLVGVGTAGVFDPANFALAAAIIDASRAADLATSEVYDLSTRVRRAADRYRDAEGQTGSNLWDLTKTALVQFTAVGLVIDAIQVGRGSASVADRGLDLACDTPGPPRTVTDLFTALRRRDAGEGGEIDVRFLDSADGRRRVIVDIPGTKSWAPFSGDAASLQSDLDEIDGAASVYEDGVLEAMRRAGVTPTDQVMLVGHSLGGMVAATAARDAVRSGRFAITHVVTAGAPIGRYAAHIPRSVQVLALENTDDIVPHLDDDHRNPDRTNLVTVRGKVAGGHHLDPAYEALAAEVDDSDDPSIRAYLKGAHGYLSGREVSAHVYVVSRGR